MKDNTVVFGSSKVRQSVSRRPRFPTGKLLATPAAMEALNLAGLTPMVVLDRHVVGDWGDVGAEDAATNEAALVYGARIFSVYTLPAEPIATSRPVTVWVITEADRACTTILLPSEY